MKKTLYLMRHGETLFNVRRKIQGWSDSPLTETGIKQAQIAKEYFKQNHIVIDHAYSSTSERASDTLEIVTGGLLAYERVKDLREMNYGTFESESQDLNPSREAYETFFCAYGGESRSQVRARIVPAIKNIMDKEDHACVLVVSHAGACFQFLGHTGSAYEDYAHAFGNCGIIKYAYDNGVFTPLEVIAHDFSSITD
jgi:Fructose-2,6-bisphosphatase